MDKSNKVETRDKYKAVWVSHSSMGDFLKCPRLYYLHNVYKNSEGRKVALVSPHMSLGVAVHNVLEGLAEHKSEERANVNLLEKYEKEWEKVTGKIGGFKNIEIENEFKERGIKMLERVQKNMGPLTRKTVHFPPKIDGEKVDMLPHYYLNDTDNIILCGKVDWLEYMSEDDSLKIIDFKTGKREESEESLQLPIYLLLLNNLQKRKISGAAYWYLEKEAGPVDVKLPNIDESYAAVYAVAKRVADAREKSEYKCKNGEEGCMHCKPFEKIVNGDAEYIGKGEYKQDLYLV